MLFGQWYLLQLIDGSGAEVGRLAQLGKGLVRGSEDGEGTAGVEGLQQTNLLSDGQQGLEFTYKMGSIGLIQKV